MEKEISKEAMEQYEKIRILGKCNMFDRNCVMHQANKRKYYELVVIASDTKEYGQLLKSYSTLMKKYGLE